MPLAAAPESTEDETLICIAERVKVSSIVSAINWSN